MPRLSARIDEDVARKIELLKQRDSSSTTEVLKAAIETYFEHQQVGASLSVKLKGLVGVSAGATNLSSTYKRHLTDELAKKL